MDQSFKLKELVFLIFAACYFQSCISISGFEEARSIGEDKFSCQLNANSSNGMQSGEAFFKYGFTDRLEMGTKVSSLLNFGLSSKYQVLGDQRSSFAMSLGSDIYIENFFTSVSAHFPLYMSYYPDKNWTINFAPKYIFQYIEEPKAVKYNKRFVGWNAGIMYGKEIKLGFDFGYYNEYELGQKSNVLKNIGLGVKFTIGQKN